MIEDKNPQKTDLENIGEFGQQINLQKLQNQSQIHC